MLQGLAAREEASADASTALRAYRDEDPVIESLHRMRACAQNIAPRTIRPAQLDAPIDYVEMGSRHPMHPAPGVTAKSNRVELASSFDNLIKMRFQSLLLAASLGLAASLFPVAALRGLASAPHADVHALHRIDGGPLGLR
jgi:hypothetical protein